MGATIVATSAGPVKPHTDDLLLVVVGQADGHTIVVVSRHSVQLDDDAPLRRHPPGAGRIRPRHTVGEYARTPPPPPQRAPAGDDLPTRNSPAPPRTRFRSRTRVLCDGTAVRHTAEPPAVPMEASHESDGSQRNSLLPSSPPSAKGGAGAEGPRLIGPVAIPRTNSTRVGGLRSCRLDHHRGRRPSHAGFLRGIRIVTPTDFRGLGAYA